jgi:DNA (cytosine-5)-methyltransferase 1
MRYLSVCSGIEAATVAWHDLGWQPAAFSEIEPFPSAVLAHHYPNVPNLGDMTKFKEWDIGTIDLLVGGTPCQSFSVAGLRKGLEDPRGNLALTYVGILDKFRPKWFVWENVPGVLSSGSGRDFGSFLGAVGQIGYGFAYRVLDAQYFGVAQRRRRVFVVGCLGDWRSAAAVLFESHSLSGNPAPSREKRQEIAGTIGARTGRSIGAQDAACGHMIPWPPEIAPTVTGGAPFSRTGNERVECDAIVPVSDPAYCLETTCNDYSRADGFNMIATPIALAKNTIGRQPQNGGNGDGFTVGGPMYTLNATGVHGVAQPIAFNFAPGKGELKDDIYITTANVSKTIDASGSNPAMHQGGTGVVQPIIGGVDYENNAHGPDDVTGPLLKGSPTGGGRPLPAVALANMAVRRLTPTECERLQGFPDSYTNIPWRKKEESPDGPRYKALGNSMAVPVMAWIGRRIADAS